MKNYFVIVLLLLSSFGFGQQPSFIEMEQRLRSLAEIEAGYKESVQISVSGVGLGDFISAVAIEHNLNVSVDDDLTQPIANNFYNAVVADVYVFLIKQYDLEIEVSGTILSFHKKKPKIIAPEPYVQKPVNVEYKNENEFLSLDLKNDSLKHVAEAITRVANKNVILSPSIKDKRVSIYVQNRPFDQVVEMMAVSNGLTASLDKNGFYYIDVAEKETNSSKTSNARSSKSGQNDDSGLVLELDPNNNNQVNVNAKNISIKSIIESASDALSEFYFMYDEPEGNATLKVENVNFEELLSHLLNGSDYTFKKTEGYYLIGNRNTEGLRATELIRLENRTIETVVDLIPSDFLKGIEIKEFIELNGLIVSGSYLKINELKAFIHSVDQVVPMVQIDIIIVFSEKTSGVTKEMKAGISDGPIATQGQVFPGIDMTLGAKSINTLINAFNGFGIINIGSVTPNFYASLRFLESNSVIDITSTPKISTLNGHEATFSV
ncbi:hypothetical protein, partial [Crocinitomix catalasitica]|uniref:hypothetical protein n=1 Tax=Crocinitomix catalasitica TaxID=184607 RepID=UPI000562CD24